MMNTDYPLIAYNNLLESTSLITMVAGTNNTSAPMTNVYDKDKLNPAIPQADATGTVTVTFDLPTATSAQVFIMGADRHDAAGFKSTGGTFTLSYWNGVAFVTLLSAVTISAANTATIYKLTTHILGLSGAVYQYQLTYTGFIANSSISIPELFLGQVLELPPVDYGFDEYNEVYRGSKLDSISGRIYKTLHYRRLELYPSWSVLDRQTFDVAINAFREDCLELLKSFWFAWQPDTSPDAVYLGIHDGDNAAYQIKTSVHRTFKLKFVETV